MKTINEEKSEVPKSALNIQSEKVPGLTKLAAVCWVIVLSILWLANLSSVLAFFNVSYLRETLIIVFLMVSLWLYKQIKTLISYRNASIGFALGLNVDSVFLKKIKKINKKLEREKNQQKINKLVEKRTWIESYLSDEAKEEIRKQKEGGKI